MNENVVPKSKNSAFGPERFFFNDNNSYMIMYVNNVLKQMKYYMNVSRYPETLNIIYNSQNIGVLLTRNTLCIKMYIYG